MKTLRLTLCFLLIAAAASAQFFQRVYGTANSRDILESGMNYDSPVTPVTQKGYVMTGYTNFSAGTALNCPMIVRTAINGAPIFNNRYRLSVLATSPPVEAKARRVITLANGNIAVFGDFTFNPGTAPTTFFYMETTPLGAPVVVRTYALSIQPASLEATSITQSQTNTQNVYVCGNTRTTTGQRRPFVMSIQTGTGNLNWAHEYNDIVNNAIDWSVEDLIESPYPNAFTGGQDIALVGRYQKTNATPGMGNLFTVDAATGTVTSFVHLYGSTFFDGAFNAIIVARSPLPGSPGYAIAGYFQTPTATALIYDTWALKVAPNASVLWSSLMDYSLMNRDDRGFDIIERFSVADNDWQYFVGGYVVNGIFGMDDEVVYKLKSAGTPYPPPNQFTYGGIGNERILQMDYYDNNVLPANNLGLSMFNWTRGSFPLLGQEDFYHTKAYFNGVTACDTLMQKQLWSPGPPLIDSTKGDTTNKVGLRNLVWQTMALQNAIICTANTIFSGSNARLAHPGSFGLSTSNLFPNPVPADNAVVNLTFDLPGVNDVVDVELYNSLGQLVMHKQETLGDGQTLLSMDLGGGLNAGIYTLTVRRNGEMTTHKISVQ